MPGCSSGQCKVSPVVTTTTKGCSSCKSTAAPTSTTKSSKNACKGCGKSGCAKAVKAAGCATRAGHCKYRPGVTCISPRCAGLNCDTYVPLACRCKPRMSCNNNFNDIGTISNGPFIKACFNPFTDKGCKRAYSIAPMQLFGSRIPVTLQG